MSIIQPGNLPPGYSIGPGGQIFDEERRPVTEETERGARPAGRYDKEGKPIPPEPTKPPPEPEPRPADQLDSGSHWYELGFRTMDEVNKRGDANYGIHAGSKVPTNSIVVTLASGKQERLVGEAIKQRGRGAVEEGRYTIPVTGHDGKTVNLTPVQVEKMADAEGKELFNLQVKAGIIEPGSRYVSFSKDEGLKYIPQSEFKRQKVERIEWEADKVLLPDDTWVTKADDARIRNELKEAPESIRKAYDVGGVTAYNKAVKDHNARVAQVTQDEVKVSTDAGMQQQQKQEIPTLEGIFKQEDKTNQYLIIQEAFRRQKKPEDYSYHFDKLSQESQYKVLAYYSTLEPAKVLGMTIPIGATPQWNRSIQGNKMIAGMIPVVGTALFWNDPPIKVGNVTIPKNAERFASILLDAGIITAWLKPGLITRTIVGVGKGKETVQAERIYQDGLKMATSTAKRLDRRLVEPLKDMAAAQKAYGSNLSNIADLEKTLVRSAGEVTPAIHENLAAQKALTSTLENNLREAAARFATVQRNAAMRNLTNITGYGRLKSNIATRVGFDTPREVSAFADDFVRDTRQTVNMAFRDIKGVKQTEKEISELLKESASVKADATKAARLIDDIGLTKPTASTQKAIVEQMGVMKAAQARNGSINLKLAEAQAKLLIAKSGEVKKLASELVIIKRDISRLQRQVTTASRSKTASLNKRISALSTQGGEIQKELSVALDAMELSWAKPFTSSGGRIITRQVPTITPRYVGSGVSLKSANMPLTVAYFTSKGIKGYASVGGETIYPSPEPLPKTPDIFIFEPAKEPYQGIVAAPPQVEPLTKPKTWPIHEPVPDWEIYPEITVIEAMKTAAGVRTLASVETKPKTSPSEKQAASTKQATATTTKSSTSPSVSTTGKVVPKVSAQSKIEPIPITEQATGMATKTATEAQQKVGAETKLGINIKGAATESLKVLPPAPLPRGGGSSKEKKWTPEEVKSAIAWKAGVVIHAIKAPYRRGIDEITFSVKNAPEGLKLLTPYKGPGSAARSATAKGKIPKRLSVDVGIQDVVISRGVGVKPQITHAYDSGAHTISNLTVKKSRKRKKSRIVW